MRLCQHCGNPILRDSDARFCSTRCKNKNNYARKVGSLAANQELIDSDPGLFFRRYGIKKFVVGDVNLPDVYLNKRGRPKGSRNKPKPPNVAGRDQ